MDSCVEKVQAQGYDKQAAVAICYTSVVEYAEADYPWEQCIADQQARGYGQDRAEKICGAIRARNRGSEHYLEAKVESGSGRIWDITIIGPDDPQDIIVSDNVEYIRSKNQRLYAVSALRESVPLWEGVKVYDNHLTDAEFAERGGMRSFLSEGVGVLTDARFDEATRSLRATLKIVDDAAAKKLLNAYEQDVLQHIGLSIDTLSREGPEVLCEGKRLPTLTGFERIFSVDIVSQPAAGGRFNRLIAALHEQEVQTMEITEEVVKGWIADALAAATNREQEVATPEEAAGVVADAVEMAAEDVPADADPVEAAQMVADVAQATADQVAAEMAPAETLEARLDLLECQLMLREKLDAAKLPPALRKTVEAAFAGRTFKEAELNTVIKRAKEAQVAGDASGQVKAGATRLNIAATLSPKDKAEIGLLQLIGRDRWDGFRKIENTEVDYVRERIPGWLKAWQTGGRELYRPRSLSNWLYSFVNNPLAMRTTEANDVATITKNAVNLFLAADYSIREEWWRPIVSEVEVDTIDDPTLARVYGFENLDVVTEGSAYTPIELSDDEETATYVKHGNYVGVTLETMLKDKLNVLQEIPRKLADSWYNTQSAKVSAVFTTNTAAGPVLTDSGALFNASAVTGAGGHANLLTAALSFTAYGAARTAMMKQTSKKLGAGRRLLIEPKFMLVPVDLETTALQIRNSELQPVSGNNDINPYYQKFEVIPVPDWTDANNWALVADPLLHPAIFMIYVRGYRVPQIFEAGDETSGAVFTNDAWRYKIRLLTFKFSSTYDCAPVADFRPLHKSNV
jgi:hypothetical protein